MGNLGGMEIVVILLVALVVLGPARLPEAARQVGKAVTEIRRISGGFQRELREAIQEPIQEAEAIARGKEITKPTTTGTPPITPTPEATGGDAAGDAPAADDAVDPD